MMKSPLIDMESAPGTPVEKSRFLMPTVTVSDEVVFLSASPEDGAGWEIVKIPLHKRLLWKLKARINSLLGREVGY